MIVGEICNREVVITRKQETILDAARRMREYHVGDLVVVEEKDGERLPVGILTDRDIVVSVIAQDIDYLSSLVVGDVMSTDLVTAREEEGLEAVLKRMRTCGVRRIPVVNAKGGLEGIVTVDDLLEYIYEEVSELVGLISRQQKREKETRT